MAFVILGAILLPITGLSFWARNQLLNTDRYVNTVAPLASDPAVQEAAANRLSQAVLDAVDLESRAKDALPDRAKFLAAPIAAGAQNLLHDLALQFVQSDQFRTLWREVNRNAHDQIRALLQGKNTTSIQRKDGQVIVSLGPLAEQLLQRLDQSVPIDLSSIPADRLNIQFVLVDSNDLATAQGAVQLFTTLTWVLFFLVIAAFVAGALVHPDRRRGLQRSALGIVISMGVMLCIYAIGRDYYLNHLPSDVQSPAAAASVFDIITRNVERGFRILLLLGVILLFGAWLPGPSRSAVWLRTKAKAAAGRDPGDVATEPVEHGGGMPGWVARHLTEVRVIIGALAILAIAVWDQPTGKDVVLFLLVVAIAFGVVQFIASAGRPRTPAAT